jgi:DNA-damage-inducible protein D
LPVIERVRQACRNSDCIPEDHFEDILELVEIGFRTMWELPDVRFSLLRLPLEMRVKT